MRKLLFLLPCLLAVVAIGMAASAPVATASGLFCSGARVNNANKCWGSGREFYEAEAKGNETGVCVGYDTVTGNCAPTYAWAGVHGVPGGIHYPWVIGTASNFTWTEGFTY